MKKLILLTAVTLAGLSPSRAANVSLTGSDGFGATSFNVAGQWSDAAAPGSANNYFTAGFRVRTPANGGIHIFLGNSLTIDAPTGANPTDSFMYKGTGNTGSLTVSNLVLNGGRVSHQNGLGDICLLYGKINVVADSQIWAKQGPINIFSEISGAGNLTIEATDANNTIGERNVTLLANNPGFGGKFTVSGKLGIVSEESLGANPGVFAADQLTINGGALRTTNSFAINDSNRGIMLSAGATIDVVNPDANTIASLTIASPITGDGLLTKIGGGILTLSGNNDFTGGVTIGNGLPAGAQLNINSASALGGSGAFTQNDADTILDNTSGSPLTLTGIGSGQVWNGSFTFLGSSSLDMIALGTVTLTADVAVTVSNNNLTVGSVYDDGLNRALTKRGPGTLTINGPGNNYYGNTVVDGGTLVLLGSAASHSTTISVASNATLNVSGPGGLTLSAAATISLSQKLAGSGNVVGNVADDGAGSTTIDPGASSGTLTINGNLGLNGGTAMNFELSPATTVGSGVNDLIVVTGQLNLAGSTTLNVTGVPTLGTYTLIQYVFFAGNMANLVPPPGYSLINNTSTKAIELIVTHVPADLIWQGDGVNNVWDIGTTANWMQSGTNQVFLSGDLATFTDSGSGSPAVTLATDVSPLAVAVNASKNYTLTGKGIATGSLTKSGSGTLILDNTNTYSGPTIINGGTLQLGDPSSSTTAGAAGSIGAGPVTNGASLLFNRTGDLTLANNMYGSGSISNISSSGSVTLSGDISGSTVTVDGFGGLALAGSNSYSGLTLVSVGTLFVRNANALGSTAANTIVTNNGRLYIDRNINISGESLTLAGGTLQKGGAGVTILSSPITLGADTTFEVDGGATLVLSNAAGLSGPIAVTKTGGGTLSLYYPSAYTGGTILSLGTINFNTNGALGPGAVTASGGRIVIAAGKNFTNSVTASSVDPGAANGFLTGLADTNGNIATVSGTLDFSASPANGGTFAGPGGSNYLNVTGPITSPAGTFVSVRDGNVRFSGGGSYPELRVGIATTSIGANNGIAANAVMDMAANVNAFTIVNFDLNGFNQTLAGLANAINVDGAGYVINRSATLSTLTLAVDPLTPQTFGGGSDGNLALVLNSGTQNLQTNNSPLSGFFRHTGDTVINGGTLALGAGVHMTNTPNITVGNGATLDVSADGLILASGQTLKGNGTINGPVTVAAGGTLSPGASIGTLTINNTLSLNGNTFIEVNKNTGTRDQIVGVTGGTYNGTLTVSNQAGTLAPTDSFQIFPAGVMTGNFTSITPAPGAGLSWSFTPASGVLSVVGGGGIPTTPTNITFNVSGGNVALSWPASHLGWILQSQTNALNVGIRTNASEWFDVTGSASVISTNIPISKANPTVFFRLRYP